uniref:Uncharacterized protein n=1 Tax=Setaria italica TaxID=4555 RepID=K3ZYE5_SETIT
MTSSDGSNHESSHFSRTTHNQRTIKMAQITDPWNLKVPIKSRIHPLGEFRMERITMLSDRALQQVILRKISPPQNEYNSRRVKNADGCQSNNDEVLQ